MLRRQSHRDSGSRDNWFQSGKEKGRRMPAWVRGPVRSGSLGCECLQARVETALVAAGSVLVENTLLDALVEDRDSGAVLNGGSLGVTGRDGFAHQTEGTAKLGLVGAVDSRAGDGLAGALKG